MKIAVVNESAIKSLYEKYDWKNIFEKVNHLKANETLELDDVVNPKSFYYAAKYQINKRNLRDKIKCSILEDKIYFRKQN